ncbi:MAG TPA: hypothetical protein VJ836_00910 [Candidatus Saccharimonadales bacterium]|nr:hypothetical protein [Candidatus Saccharimonadales bacterium]
MIQPGERQPIFIGQGDAPPRVWQDMVQLARDLGCTIIGGNTPEPGLPVINDQRELANLPDFRMASRLFNDKPRPGTLAWMILARAYINSYYHGNPDPVFTVQFLKRPPPREPASVHAIGDLYVPSLRSYTDWLYSNMPKEGKDVQKVWLRGHAIRGMGIDVLSFCRNFVRWRLGGENNAGVQ